MMHGNFIYSRIKGYVFSFLFLFGCTELVFGQNLVPNPSFEDYDTCPEFLSQINYAIGWGSSRQTPEYYNSCAIPFTVASVPHNYFGSQYPASGNAYAG